MSLWAVFRAGTLPVVIQRRNRWPSETVTAAAPCRREAPCYRCLIENQAAQRIRSAARKCRIQTCPIELSSVPRPFLYIVMFIQLDCETVSGIEMENNAAINPVAGTFGVIYWTQMKKPITSDRLKLKNGSGEWNRTIGLQVMSLTSYHCSTPRYKSEFLRRSTL